jgi:hypothetical protein
MKLTISLFDTAAQELSKTPLITAPHHLHHLSKIERCLYVSVFRSPQRKLAALELEAIDRSSPSVEVGHVVLFLRRFFLLPFCAPLSFHHQRIYFLHAVKIQSIKQEEEATTI